MMAATLLLLAGWAVICVLMALDRRLAGTWVTPFTALALPLLVVLTMTEALASPMGFAAPSTPAIALLLLGPIIFWCGEAAALGWAGSPPPFHVEGRQRWLGEEESRRLASIVSWAAVAVMAFGFVRAMRGLGSLGQVVQVEFQERFQRGASGFARPIAMLLVVYWIGTMTRWTRREALALAGLLAFLGASFVKGTVLLPLVGGLLYRVLSGRLRLTFPRLAAAGLGGLVLFVSVYIVQAVVWGLAGLAAPGFGRVLGRRVLGAIFAGVLGFSGTWQGGILPGPADWRILFSPLWNLAAHFGGFERVANVPTAYLLVDLRANSTIGTSNVRTLFGTLWTFAGPLGAATIMLGLGVGLGLLYAAARRTRNGWLLVVSSFLGAALVFGWFEYYFWHPFWYVTVPLGLLAALAVRPLKPGRILEGAAP